MVRRPKETIDQPETGNGFKRLGARLAKTTRRSAWSIWLAEGDHYDQLTAQMTTHGVRWGEIAQWAMDEGYAKEALTAVAAKRAYEREKAKREQSVKTSPKPAQASAEKRLNTPATQPVTQVLATPSEPPSGFINPDKPKSRGTRNFVVSTPKKEI